MPTCLAVAGCNFCRYPTETHMNFWFDPRTEFAFSSLTPLLQQRDLHIEAGAKSQHQAG